MDKSAEAFWADFERETGEKVLAKTMGQIFLSKKDKGEWGLLVLSPTGLRFRKTPGESWFASLLRAEAKPVTRYKEDDIFIPYSSITRLARPPKRFFDFLFGSPFLSFIVETMEDGGAGRYCFSVDPKNDFFSRLEKLSRPAG